MPTRVLLVDDEPEFLAVMSERLESRGLVVQTAQDGHQALQLVEGRNYDAVVLDLAMPGMDGIETLKAMLQRNPDLQVILLTGHATLQKGLEAIKSGAMEFLEKPADLDTLLEKIRQAADQRVMLIQKHAEDTVMDVLRKRSW